ncbi:MAG TPA: hypothetical protein DCY38_04820 [Opitutae bacterium]|nr:hypothetical protein [Opitutae bacterium]
MAKKLKIGWLKSASDRYKGLLHCFKKTAYSIDSSLNTLVANCMDWAASNICGLYQSCSAIEVFFK